MDARIGSPGPDDASTQVLCCHDGTMPTEPEPEPQPEIAPERPAPRTIHRDHLIELAAVVLLGAGTMFAAWAGYQAAIWNGIQAADYVQGQGTRVEATKAATLAGQERLYDADTFSQWLDATFTGDQRLAALYERRFRDEFRVAFDAWQKTDPFDDPAAPPGPLVMPDYVQANATKAAELEAQAADLINAGQAANDVSDHYVLFTVIFATVLFMGAIADRFKWYRARIAVLVIGYTVLLYGVVGVAQLPVA